MNMSLYEVIVLMVNIKDKGLFSDGTEETETPPKLQ